MHRRWKWGNREVPDPTPNKKITDVQNTQLLLLVPHRLATTISFTTKTLNKGGIEREREGPSGIEEKIVGQGTLTPETRLSFQTPSTHAAVTPGKPAPAVAAAFAVTRFGSG